MSKETKIEETKDICDVIVKLAPVIGASSAEAFGERMMNARMAAAAAAAVDEIGRIKAKKLVSFNATSYSYQPLDLIIEQTKGVLNKHGLWVNWETSRGPDGELSVVAVLRHKDGGTATSRMSASPDMSGKKNPIQAAKSAITYMKRITYMSVIGLEAGEEDDDGVSAGANDGGMAEKETVSMAQAEALKKIAAEAQADVDAIFNHFGVSSWDDIPALAFPALRARLMNKIAEMNENGADSNA